MPARKQIHLQAFKEDYQAGMAGRDLEAKYAIGKNSVSKWARRAGAKLRSGRGPARKVQASAALTKSPRRAGKIASASDGDIVTLCLTAAALDQIWAGLPLERKAELIESFS